MAKGPIRRWREWYAERKAKKEAERVRVQVRLNAQRERGLKLLSERARGEPMKRRAKGPGIGPTVARLDPVEEYIDRFHGIVNIIKKEVDGAATNSPRWNKANEKYNRFKGRLEWFMDQHAEILGMRAQIGILEDELARTDDLHKKFNINAQITHLKEFEQEAFENVETEMKKPFPAE